MSVKRAGYLDELFRFGGSVEIAVGDTSAATSATDEQTAAKLLLLTGTLTAARTVTLRARTAGADWLVRNDCTGGYAVTVQGPTGAGVTVQPGAVAHVVSDGSALVTAARSVITNADVAAAAAIDGSKITAAFGAQAISTELGIVIGSTGSFRQTFGAKKTSTSTTPLSLIGVVGIADEMIIRVTLDVVAIKSDFTAFWEQSVDTLFRVDPQVSIVAIGSPVATTARTEGVVSGLEITIEPDGTDAIRGYFIGRAAETWRVGARMTVDFRTLDA